MTYAEFASIFQEVNKNQSDREHLLQWRYPWFNMVFNYVFAFLLVLLAVSLIWWSGNVYHDRKEVENQNERDRIQAAEQAEAEAQKQKELETTLNRWSDAGAKMLYGIRNFIKLYHYSEKDLETYLRCAWNRYQANGKLTDLDIIIFKEDQFLESYRTWPALPKYKAIAEKYFAEWMNENEKDPLCDYSFVHAELTPNGIYLVEKFGADGYAPRWKVR